MMTMRATVLSTQRGRLLVFDQAMLQRVIVHARNACHFCVGDHVCIRYSGAMTMSIPPQYIQNSPLWAAPPPVLTGL